MKLMAQIRPKSTKKSMKPNLSAIAQTERDFKDAVLTVSIFANLFLLSIWVAVQVTSTYDEALATFFMLK